MEVLVKKLILPFILFALIPFSVSAKSVTCQINPATYEYYVFNFRSLPKSAPVSATFDQSNYSLMVGAGTGSLSFNQGIYSFELSKTSDPVNKGSLAGTSIKSGDPVLVGDRFVFEINADQTAADGKWIRENQTFKDISCYFAP